MPADTLLLVIILIALTFTNLLAHVFSNSQLERIAKALESLDRIAELERKEKQKP
jgi:hypothetical protein